MFFYEKYNYRCIEVQSKVNVNGKIAENKNTFSLVLKKSVINFYWIPCDSLTKKSENESNVGWINLRYNFNSANCFVI